MKKISANMLKVLNDIRRGINPYFDCHGRSQHSSRARTLMALFRRGFLSDRYKLTEAGRELLAAELLEADLLATFMR